ncbi:hypothetical protein G5B39_03310 [Rhodobacteraceae bacterium SC52]|nr:hypothetical protein G5B39_03310 [Rhodobacteraceae bacterium SC52]
MACDLGAVGTCAGSVAHAGETTCGLECIEVDLPGSAMDGADEDDEILQPRFEAEQEFLGDIEGPATVDGKADAASDLLSQPDR